MNILIPDEWLRQHVDTKATPKQLKEYLSLCGPSVERIHEIDGHIVYDIEVTTNRIDMMSVRGIAREAAVILPQFGVDATLIEYHAEKTGSRAGGTSLDITIINDSALCDRILTLKVSGVTLGESPSWMKKRLELVGQRSLNNIIDITNYVMWEVGHPLHAFDYDSLKSKKILVRLAKKGEKLTTLDGKTHTLTGQEIVFDDGKGTIIDLPGIMGCANTVVTEQTKNVLFVVESSDPVRIRRTSMGLSIRSQAAILNEKHPDPELGVVALTQAATLAVELSGGHRDSELVDVYPKKAKPHTITVSSEKIDQYIGMNVEAKEITSILERLGCIVHTKKHDGSLLFEVKPPSLRADDLRIPEDVIEEVARIIGYHTIAPRLPEQQPPPVLPDTELFWESEIKVRLRDWGYTEIYGYSMISQASLATMNIDEHSTYKITNPLTVDHEYLRPTLLPTMLSVLAENIPVAEELALFELSHTYHVQDKNIPREQAELCVAIPGNEFLKLKGLAEALFLLMGVPFPSNMVTATEDYYKKGYSLQLEQYGSIGIVKESIGEKFSLKKMVTVLSLNISALVADAKPHHAYEPIPKHPPVIEDFSFVFTSSQFMGPVLKMIKELDTVIHQVTLLDMYEDNRTIRVHYLNPEKTLTSEEIRPIREKILTAVGKHFHARLVE